MKKLLVTLLLGTTLLCGCSNNTIEIKQAREIYTEKDGYKRCDSPLNMEQLKIVEKSLDDKLFKSIIKECGIENVEVYVTKYTSPVSEDLGGTFFIDCYIDVTNLTLAELSLLKDKEDTLIKLWDVVNVKLNGFASHIIIKDIKCLKTNKSGKIA